VHSKPTLSLQAAVAITPLLSSPAEPEQATAEEEAPAKPAPRGRRKKQQEEAPAEQAAAQADPSGVVAQLCVLLCAYQAAGHCLVLLQDVYG